MPVPTAPARRARSLTFTLGVLVLTFAVAAGPVAGLLLAGAVALVATVATAAARSFQAAAYVIATAPGAPAPATFALPRQRDAVESRLDWLVATGLVDADQH